MKKWLLVGVVLVLGRGAFAQADPILKQRLNQFFEANKAMDFEKVLDYTYPKLFTIATRKQMMAVMNSTFNNEDMKITMDSLMVDSLYPGFILEGGTYAKINYSMKMVMKFNQSESESAEAKKEYNEAMLSAMQEQFGKDNARLDNSGLLHVRVSTVMVAIKDEYAKDWCFINLKEDDPLTGKLFSKALLDKLATFK